MVLPHAVVIPLVAIHKPTDTELQKVTVNRIFNASLSLPSPPTSLPHYVQSRLDSHQGEAYVTISTLQEEREELLQVKDECQQYIRQLEQKNDDLERQMR